MLSKEPPSYPLETMAWIWSKFWIPSSIVPLMRFSAAFLAALLVVRFKEHMYLFKVTHGVGGFAPFSMILWRYHHCLSAETA